MARIKSLPGLDVIRGLKGTLDYYLWKGLPCVRSWPRTPRHHLTPATLAAAAIFGQVLKSYRLLADTVLAAFQEDAADHERTARDIYVAAVHGHLHEAAMSDFLTALQACRDSLAALEALLGALGSIDTDDIQVDVKTSALPALAATAAHQVTQNTALAKIDDLQDALESVATDRLIVRGENQLFSFLAPLANSRTAAISGADGWVESNPPTAGQIWKITTIDAMDLTSATTGQRRQVRIAAVAHRISATTIALAAGKDFSVHGEWWLTPDRKIRVHFLGGLGGDSCVVTLHGHQMTLET